MYPDSRSRQRRACGPPRKEGRLDCFADQLDQCEIHTPNDENAFGIYAVGDKAERVNECALGLILAREMNIENHQTRLIGMNTVPSGNAPSFGHHFIQ